MMIRLFCLADSIKNDFGRGVRLASGSGSFCGTNVRFVKSRFLFPVNITAMEDFVQWTGVHIAAKGYG